MKIIYQILFILIIFSFSFFIVKDDFIDTYKKGIVYLDNKINVNLKKVNDFSIVKDTNEAKEIKIKTELPKKIEEPGVLKITDKTSLLNSSNISNFRLSKEGVIEITNKYRNTTDNLGLLIENDKLNLSARKKLEDMFNKQYFEHVSPEDIRVSDLADQVSYKYITVGENLAMGNFNNDQALVDAWMASTGHRENILNKHYTEIGVAVGEGIYEGKKIWMAVQHFGLPQSFCPEIDDLLRGLIEIEEKQIKTIEDELALRKQKIEDKVVYENLTTNEQIIKYNGIIAVYNQLLLNLKEKIDIYNKQVRDFNACLAENNSEIVH